MNEFPHVQVLYSKKLTGISYADWTCNLQCWYCTKVSAGCKNCYMLHTMYKGNLKSKPEWRENGVREFMKMPAGAVVFVGDMYDVYHEENRFEWIKRTHDLIAQRPEITVLLLTKRPHIALRYADKLKWPKHLWFGTTVENRAVTERIAQIKRLPADNLWLSVEPMLEDITPALSGVVLSGIKWMVCGGESGPGRRRFSKSWALRLQRLCERLHIPFFFKQSSGLYPGHDPFLNGIKYWEFPDGIAPLKYSQTIETKQLPVQMKMFED